MTSPDFKNPDGEARAICVFCGSGAGASPEFTEAARLVGALLAQKGVGLVYGGGDIGLMGEVARSALAHGGRVTGIIPDFLIRREHMPDPAEQGRETIIVSDMHTRKRLMYERADAFLALPGGIGTLEELVEMMTWAQLGRHRKPVLLANINGFWDPLVALLRHMSSAGFIRSGFEVNYLVADNAADILPKLLKASAEMAAPELAVEPMPIEDL